MEPTWLRLHEAAEIVGVNRKTAYRWFQNYLKRERGEDYDDGPLLPGYTAPGSTHIWVKDNELVAFMNEFAEEISDIIERRDYL